MRCRSLSTTALLAAVIACCGSANTLARAQTPDSDPSPQSVAVPDEWQLFIREEERFQIAMPGPPAAYSFAVDPNTAGTSRMYMQMQLVDATHLEVYAAAFVEEVSFGATEENSDEAATNCALSLGNSAQLIDTQPLTSAAYRGAEALFLKPDNGFQVSQCFLVGDRAYMLTATREPFDAGGGLQPLVSTDSSGVEPVASGPEATQQQSSTMAAFFNSFEILE